MRPEERINILVQAIEALENQEYAGFCLACGCGHDGIEPDAEGYECSDCGAYKVMGAENILLTGGLN